jgi:hypothetical protein
MYRFYLLLFSLPTLLFSQILDYDAIVVGSSPISLLEALHLHYTGQKVLIVEASDRCGGAWQPIKICGIPNVDLGCHQIGSDMQVYEFLKEYLGCSLVSLEDPNQPYQNIFIEGDSGFYPSQGCFELLGNILKLIENSEIDLMLNTKAKNIWVDFEQQYVEISTSNGTYRSKRCFITPNSHITLQNSFYESIAPQTHRLRYYHLYLLINDPSEWRFTYKPSPLEGSSRLMNMTPFLGLESQGLQMIALQIFSKPNTSSVNEIFNHLKSHHLIDQSAHLICSETHMYEQLHYKPCLSSQMTEELKPYIELLNTAYLHEISRYVSKWKKSFKPFKSYSPEHPLLMSSDLD